MSTQPALLAMLQDHVQTEPWQLPVLEQKFPFYDRANLHMALEEICAEADEPPKLCGVVVGSHYETVNLAKLCRPTSAEEFDVGPVEYVDVALPNEQRLSCVKRGLYLFKSEGVPIAVLIAELEMVRSPGIVVEVMTSDKERAEKFTNKLNRLVRHGKAFRGSVLSLEHDCFGNTSIQFHSLPAVDRSQVILPAELLDRIERHTIAFSQQAKKLVAAGRHLKRGILLHGPPGTGKTFSAMYLASQMPGRTVFLLTGQAMGSIEAACRMARVLQPTTIILEDVDLIGTERNNQMVGANALLFELLNQMDGLADDADVLFILTTNRPDILEPALASRPGRIDQAILVPPPDEECRRRLIALYSQGLKLEAQKLEQFIHQMEGVSAAFIREWLRKAAVFAAIDSQSDAELTVTDAHLEEALSELLVAGGPLTQSLLGGGVPPQEIAGLE